MWGDLKSLNLWTIHDSVVMVRRVRVIDAATQTLTWFKIVTVLGCHGQTKNQPKKMVPTFR